jgi:thymidylate synthase
METTRYVMTYPNMRVGYPAIAQFALQNGDEVSPRGLKTREVCDFLFRIEDPNDAYAVGTGRNLSPRIAAAEAIQLIGGFSSVELTLGASRNFEAYLEDDRRFWGAYGRRISDQVYAVVNKLTRDRDTRQAVITIWDPRLDNPIEPRRDHPCTIALSFRIRRDKLNMLVHMRSSDVWLGIPYDVFQFTQLQLTIATTLRVVPGVYTHLSESLHVYESNWDDVANLTISTASPPEVYGFASLSFDNIIAADECKRWTNAKDRAQLIGQGSMAPFDMTSSEKWYAERVRESYTRYTQQDVMDNAADMG